MHKISSDRPETFVEAVQLLFSFHCCLHLSGEPTSIGRLDQLLEPFLQGTPSEEAQEIIDCLFVKLCEHVHLNSRLLNDLGAWGMTAVPYASTGMFPNGDTINQWVQQVRTVHYLYIKFPLLNHFQILALIELMLCYIKKKIAAGFGIKKSVF